MHKIQEKEFTLEDFSCEHLDRFVEDTGGDIAPVLDFKRPMEYTIEMLNKARIKYLETKDKKYWWQMIQLLPSSYNQTRNVMMNYEVLCNIYKSRKSHKLNEWCELCAWVEELPYSELICGDGIKEGLNNIDDEIVDKVADKFCEIGNINPLSKEKINRIKEE